MPADAVPGSTIPEDSEAEIRLRDGSWVWAQVIGQRKDRHGRCASGSAGTPAPPWAAGKAGSYDPRLIRRPPLTPWSINAVSAERPAAAPPRADPGVAYAGRTRHTRAARDLAPRTRPRRTRASRNQDLPEQGRT